MADTKSTAKFTWTLYTPIGAFLARGTAATEDEAKKAAHEKLLAMGRKRGSVIVRPA